MTRGNLIKLCAAALAGSIMGIAYERMPPSSNWPTLFGTASAYSSIISRNDKINRFDDSIGHYKLPDVNPAISTENLKHSAKFGLPSKDNLRIFNDFVLSYDRRLRAANWVIEHLTPEKLKNKNVTDRDRSKFQEDIAIHEYFRAKNADFIHSGYDRGHMAAAANHKNSQDDLDQTFAFSNISPQAPEFNRGAWCDLETYVRWRANRSKNLYVVSGPLYLPMKARDGNLYVTYRVLGNNHVSVPTHHFKVFLIETNDDTYILEAFLMPNDNSMTSERKLDEFRVPIHKLDVIERASGVIFFDQLNREKVEAPTAIPDNFKQKGNRRKAITD